MKKGFKFLALACAGLMLVGCGVSQKTADQINAAAATEKTSDDWTVEKCKKQLGEPTYDLTVTVLGSTNGSMIWVVGCKNGEEVSKKQEAGKELKALTVAIINGVAAKASYGTYSSSEK